MARNYSNDQIQNIANKLEGSCSIAGGVWPEDGLEPTVDDRAYLDTCIFLCEGCGWWCSTDELNNDNGEELCDDCAKIADSDEDESD